MSYLFAFSYCSWGSQVKNAELVCCSFLSGPCFFQSSEERVIGSWAKQMKGLLFSCLVVSDSVTPWTASFQASPSFTISRSFIKLMSIELMMPSNHLISVIPFSYCLKSFPTSGSSPLSWLLTSGSQSTGTSVSASVLPMKTQDCPLRLTCLKSFQSKGLSRVFSNTIV